MNKCNLCYRFYKYDRTKGHRKNICNSCNANRRRAEIKQKMVAYKGGSCERCGYSRSIRALNFHHLDRTLKNFNLSKAYTKKWNLIVLELDKCQLLCANCHMEVEEALLQE